MFHFRLISANDLSKWKCVSFVKILPNLAGHSDQVYCISEKGPKSTSPVYNQEFQIPFYCYDELTLLFFEKKIGKEQSLGYAKIPLAVETFMNTEPQTIGLTLYNSFKGANPTVTFSISYLPFISLPIASVLNPMNIYAYLTYDPPLQVKVQNVDLICQGLDENGTIYRQSLKWLASTEKEPKRCGPTGLTEVYHFEHSHIPEGKFFFYLKSYSYNGKVTLNIATAPDRITTDNHDLFCLLDNSSSLIINTNGENVTTYGLFPLKLLLHQESVSVAIVDVPSEICIQQTPFVTSDSPKLTTIHELMDYYMSNPEGICERKIINAGATSLKFYSKEKISTIRFEASVGQKYSLTDLFRYNNILSQPKDLIISYSYIPSSPVHLHVATSGPNPSSINAYDITKSNMPPFSDSLTDTNGVQNDQDFFHLSLDKIDASIRFIGLFASASFSPKVCTKEGNLITKTIWADVASFRISDFETRKEIMCCKLPVHQSPCGVLTILLVRINANDWEIWPVSEFFQVHPPDSIKDCKQFFTTFLFDGPLNKMFGVQNSFEFP